MEVCKVVIPSYKRATRVLTTQAVDNAIICVPESQATLYRACNLGIEIVTHPDSVVGLPLKREWIRRHFGSVFMLDDDITDLKRVYTGKGEDATVDPDVAYEIIQMTADAARQAGAYAFGFGVSPNPINYNSLSPIRMSGYLTGCAHGILSGSRLWYNPEVFNEDYWISLLNAYEHRMIWRDERFYWAQRDTFVNPGGLSEFRNMNVEEEDFKTLQRIFGKEVVTLKKQSSTSKLKHPFQKTLKLPF